MDRKDTLHHIYILKLLKLILLWHNIWTIPPNIVCNIYVIILHYKLSINNSLRNQKHFESMFLLMLPHSLMGKKSSDSSEGCVFANIARWVTEHLMWQNNTENFNVISCFLGCRRPGSKENGAVGLLLEHFG